MRLSGLGSTLTPAQIYQTAIGAGFPSDVAVQMTAIAMRESGGNPTATNLSNTEQSYGLWQINIQGNPGLMAALGITDPSQLLDPAINAQAAAYLWGGNPNNLNVAWYINRPGYQQAYEQYLPAAQQAALDAGFQPSPAIYDPGVSGGTVDASVLPASLDPMTVALIVGGGLLAVWMFR